MGDTSVGDVVIKLGSDEVVVIPKRGVAFFCAPLVVSEDHHGDSGPFIAPASGHFVHGNTKGSVACEPDNRCIRLADFRTKDRRETVAARAKQTRSQIFTPVFERWISISDGAGVTDVGTDDRLLRQG